MRGPSAGQWIVVQLCLAALGMAQRAITAIGRLPGRAWGALVRALGFRRDPNDTDGDGQFG